MVAGQAVGESEQGNSAPPKRAITHGGYQVLGARRDSTLATLTGLSSRLAAITSTEN